MSCRRGSKRSIAWRARGPRASNSTSNVEQLFKIMDDEVGLLEFVDRVAVTHATQPDFTALYARLGILPDSDPGALLPGERPINDG